MIKIRGIKSLEFTLLRLWKKESQLEKKKAYLLTNRAALRGVWDYLTRQFGNAPPWIQGEGK